MGGLAAYSRTGVLTGALLCWAYLLLYVGIIRHIGMVKP